MNTIRGYDWLFYGDGTDSGQDSILSVVASPETKSVSIEVRTGCASPVVKALQENTVLYAQTDAGLYRIKYTCPFKGLDASAFPNTVTTLQLKLANIDFLEGFTSHDTLVEKDV